MTYLYVGFAEEADEHINEDGHNVEHETGPIIDFECCHEGSDQHQEDVAWSQNGTPHHQDLQEFTVSTSDTKTLLAS